MVGRAEFAERWEELEGAREVAESMEETELEEGLRRRRDEPAALGAEPGVRGVRVRNEASSEILVSSASTQRNVEAHETQRTSTPHQTRRGTRSGADAMVASTREDLQREISAENAIRGRRTHRRRIPTCLPDTAYGSSDTDVSKLEQR